MRNVIKNLIFSVPSIRQLRDHRDELAAMLTDRQSTPVPSEFVSLQPNVLQYRKAYYEVHGTVAPNAALPNARAWPNTDNTLSYRDKLLSQLPVKSGKGAELGPLNLPMLSKREANVLYVDHLDTAGLKAKYPCLTDLPEVDRPMMNDSLQDTLRTDAPLDYVVASQVMEHVPNPIRWMNEVASVLRMGGLLSISLPDRRRTFDLYREESRPSDMIAAYLQDNIVPDARAVYDHHSQASSVNMHWAMSDAVYPSDVINGNGAVSAKILAANPIELTKQAQSGAYLDVHCWVFTPPSFLLLMAQIAREGFLKFRCKQFYPTNFAATERDNASFSVVLEKTDAAPEVIRRSYLEALA